MEEEGEGLASGPLGPVEGRSLPTFGSGGRTSQGVEGALLMASVSPGGNAVEVQAMR